MRGKIVKYPNKVLRKRSGKVAEVTEAERKLLEEMAVSMKENNGIGLAAPQVGINRRMITAQTPQGIIKLVNPVIEKKEGQSMLNEGCLSLPGTIVKVKRARKVTVSGLDEKGEPLTFEAEGIESHVFQHEIDHLEGRLIIDYMPLWTRLKFYLYGKKREKNENQTGAY